MDPFAKKIASNWVSLEEYQQRPHPPDPSLLPVVSSAVPSQEKNEIAHPGRELNLPIMPGLATAPAVTVSSTEQLISFFPLEKGKWLGVREEYQEAQKQEIAASMSTRKDKPAFQIRLSLLPSAQVQSIPAARISQGKLAREANAARAAQAAQGLEQKTIDSQKIKQRMEACEAFTLYRRRQLEALASDRDTLAQLKSVLSDLGLTTKLNFMTNAGEALTAEVKETSQSAAKAPENLGAAETKTP
ncbi:MAG: hypothetical protein PHD48_02395 [Alphaproteobacteria bacterium]|nr:hypothetical protein [Alphaproteobacteria bacterium]